MPILGIWHGLGQLMREGLVQPWGIDDLSLEMFTFYVGVLEAEANEEKRKMAEAKANAKKHHFPRLHR